MEQDTLGLLDITVRRNAFGRQIASAEVDLDVPSSVSPPFPGIFIRAPWVERAGAGSKCSRPADGHGVFVSSYVATFRNVISSGASPGDDIACTGTSPRCVV